MSNEQILFQTCSFFASERWWKPIVNFVYTKNGDFKGENIKHEEYQKFIEFSEMVVNLIDVNLCSYIGIPAKNLENVILSTYEDGNVQTHVIIDTLKKTMNFEQFREEMTQSSIRTECVINELLMQFAADTTITSSDELAARVTEETQKKLDEMMDEIINKGCRQMRGLLSLDIIETKRSVRRPMPKHKSKKPKNSPSDNNNDEVDANDDDDVIVEVKSNKSDKNDSNDNNDRGGRKETLEEEIERRRQFFIQQRDILSQKEHRTPPSAKAPKKSTKEPNSAKVYRYGRPYHKIPD